MKTFICVQKVLYRWIIDVRRRGTYVVEYNLFKWTTYIYKISARYILAVRETNENDYLSLIQLNLI